MTKKGEFLKERAEKFFENAQYLLQKEYFDLAAFNFEQAAQLFLKYYLFASTGSYPFVHSIESLLIEVLKVHPQKEKIEDILKNYQETIFDLEEAYISARYLPSHFSKNKIAKMKEFVKKLKGVLFQ
jgi:HEPN domain-containing protein